ncbi:cytochrome c [Flavitalea sp. BT771]|uniref:c-type cytochrome n=1 Tax=Flavitalea sp. BT771 TaxID=3063329 RepID=UPI0026E4638C|nr:cytochrome c [Flavitalea sp. BT771]MDO6432401.1 cytochrome c [Flavitalea sp. BT771]MDV6221311.1 cytochrome c [Flavitalea sp. BT771]
MNRLFVMASTALLAFLLMSQTQKPAAKGGALAASIARGKVVYESTCQPCHMADGGGAPNMNPPLSRTKWVLGDKVKLAQIVLKGLPGGQIEIDGDTFHNPMPAQESVLSDQQIADVLTFVRNNFGNKASAVTVAEVKASRGRMK